jgi:hypothetical protein
LNPDSGLDPLPTGAPMPGTKGKNMVQYPPEYHEKKESFILQETEAVTSPIRDLVAAVIKESLTNPIPPNQEQNEQRTLVRTMARFAVLLAALSSQSERTSKRLLGVTWVILIFTVALFVFEIVKRH